jgi:hypothetical protein
MADCWLVCQRPDIPADLLAPNGSQIDTTTWGVPAANYPGAAQGGCDIPRFFAPQALTLDISTAPLLPVLMFARC